jgi:hypothetical protein
MAANAEGIPSGAAALQTPNMQITNQVHADNFQFCPKPMQAMNFAVHLSDMLYLSGGLISSACGRLGNT